MNPVDRIYVAGHNGLVGSAIVRRLKRDRCSNLLTRSRQELDLMNAVAVERFFQQQRPEYVFVAAAKVGGIVANQTYPADFIRENLAIALNVISAAHEAGVRKLLFLSSSCVYPRLAPQPLKEEYILTGALEETNDAYAIAKIAGMKMCEAYYRQHGRQFFSVLPTNVYGPRDNFDLETSHVLPALIRKMHMAKETGAPAVTLWGTGTPRREFIHSDDLADACVYLMEHYDGVRPVNIGHGKDMPISVLARLIARVVGYSGEIRYDSSRPDGTPRKVLDTSKLSATGWRPQIDLEQGIADTYQWFCDHLQSQTGPAQ